MRLAILAQRLSLSISNLGVQLRALRMPAFLLNLSGVEQTLPEDDHVRLLDRSLVMVTIEDFLKGVDLDEREEVNEVIDTFNNSLVRFVGVLSH